MNTVIVEKNLRTIDLCEILKVKRNKSGIAWSIVETWPSLGIGMCLITFVSTPLIFLEDLISLFTFATRKLFSYFYLS